MRSHIGVSTGPGVTTVLPIAVDRQRRDEHEVAVLAFEHPRA
jgi:hypothetical protein